eukprot:COSAG02_NODE_18951_length_909_cov_0.807407_2_plen_68_part_01
MYASYGPSLGAASAAAAAAVPLAESGASWAPMHRKRRSIDRDGAPTPTARPPARPTAQPRARERAARG